MDEWDDQQIDQWINTHTHTCSWHQPNSSTRQKPSTVHDTTWITTWQLWGSEKRLQWMQRHEDWGRCFAMLYEIALLPGSSRWSERSYLKCIEQCSLRSSDCSHAVGWHLLHNTIRTNSGYMMLIDVICHLPQLLSPGNCSRTTCQISELTGSNEYRVQKRRSVPSRSYCPVGRSPLDSTWSKFSSLAKKWCHQQRHTTDIFTTYLIQDLLADSKVIFFRCGALRWQKW